jgi:hypothetical protein
MNQPIADLPSGFWRRPGFDVIAAFENALGRMPTAEEFSMFDQYMTTAAGPTAIANLATMAVALAQYASDMGADNNRTEIDPNQALVTTAPGWIAPAHNTVQIWAEGSYAVSNCFISDQLAGAVTVSGNGNVIVVYNGSALTVNGYNNAIDNVGGTSTVTGTALLVSVEGGGVETVNGGMNQIAGARR